MKQGAITLLALALLLPVQGFAQAPVSVPGSQAQVKLSFAPVVKTVAPAVVNIYTRSKITVMDSPFMADPFFQQFFGGNMRGLMAGVPREQVVSSLGSGVIISPEGMIVTSHHVIRDAQEIRVVMAGGREFDATVTLKDPKADLAFLSVKAEGKLPYVALRDSDTLEVGDLVLAVGNPFGVGQTVTSGIVSALARRAEGVSDYSFFIQTDAAINRGNSGGALVDMNGSLVGINSAIFSETGGSNGIGFAIPAEMVRRVVESAVSGGTTVVRPWLGARLQTVTADLARSLGLPRPEGAVVSDLYPRSAGERAGLRSGDVIISVGGVDVRDEASVRYQFATQRPGTRVPLTVLRDGRQVTLTASAEAPPGGSPQARELSGRHPLSGARVVTLTPATAEAAGLDPFADGVFIQALDRGGVAARIGFRPGDIIDEVNGQPMRDAAQLDRVMAQARTWVIGVERNGQRAELRF